FLRTTPHGSKTQTVREH
uniref:Uncharacterized protein n=1 Tax=Myotis lucifugus TaxID=59463 RepID=G1PYZ8_MYOLU